MATNHTPQREQVSTAQPMPADAHITVRVRNSSSAALPFYALLTCDAFPGRSVRIDGRSVEDVRWRVMMRLRHDDKLFS